MKKVLLVLTTFFFALSLTGCFLAPEDIEEISEEYCRENPSSEICQGEIIDDLQDEAVINVFNTILDEYTDEENTTFCDDYFSITNVDLLDDCRASRAFLFPLEIDGYQIDSVEKEDTLSTQSIYKITVVSDSDPTKYIFTVSLVRVEGTMFINAWSYVEDKGEQPNPIDGVVPEAAAKAYFEQFLADYTNPNISSEIICETYLKEDDQEECKEERDESIALHITAVLVSFVPYNDIFKVEITASDDQTDPANDQFEVKFGYDDLDQIVMEFLDDGNQYDDFYQIYQDILTAFMGTTDPDAFCNDVMVPDEVQNCINGHQEMVQEGYTLHIHSFESFDDYFKVSLKFIYPDATEKFMEMKIWFISNGNGGWLMDQQPLDGPIVNEITQFIINFVDDFKDLSNSDSLVCYRYFLVEDAEGCIERRTKFRDENETLELGYLEVFNDMTFNVEFIFKTSDGVPTHEELSGYIVYDNNGNMKLRFEDNNNDGEFHQLLVLLVADFNNHALSNDEVCNRYFENIEDVNGCTEKRNEVFTNNQAITLTMFENREYDLFEVEFKFTGPNEYTETVLAKFFYNYDGVLKVTFVNNESDPITWDDAQAYLDLFVQQFNNQTILTQNLLDDLVHMNSHNNVLPWREAAMLGQVTITYYWLYEDYGNYSFEFEMTDGMRISFDVIWHQDNGNYRAELVPRSQPGLSFNDAWGFVDSVVQVVNTASMNAAEICMDNFTPMSQVVCTDIIEEIYVNGYVIRLDNLYQDGDFFIAYIVYNDDGAEFTREWHLHVFHDDNGFYGEFKPMDDLLTFEQKNTLVLDFINSLNEDGIGSDICNDFVTPDSVQLCLDLRVEIQNNDYYAAGYELEFERHPYFIIIGLYNHSDDQTAYFVEYAIEFHTMDDGTLRLNLKDEMRYRHTLVSNADTIVTQMVADLNDFTMSDDQFCNLWGHLFVDCYGTRSRIANENLLATKSFFNGMDDDRHFELHIALNDGGMFQIDLLRFDLTIVEMMDGDILVRGHQLVDTMPPMYDGYALLERFLTLYFDSSLSDQDIMNQLNDGYEMHGLIHRQEILADDWNWRIISVNERNDYGYLMYQAVIGIARDDDPEIEIPIEFEIYFNMRGEPVISLVFPFDTPVYDEVYAYAAVFLFDLGTMASDDDFCNAHMNNWDLYSCYELRRQLIESGYTVQLGDIIIEDYMAYFYLEFIDAGTTVSTIRFDIYQEYDLFYTVYFKAFIVPGDQAVLNEFVTYVDAITYAFNTHGLNLTTFCNEFAVCRGGIDDLTSQLHEVQYVNVYWNLDDVFNPVLQVNLIFEYMDGRMMYQQYSATFEIVDGDYNWTFYFEGEKVVVPLSAGILDQTATETALDQFLLDVIDDTITSEALCDMYFGGYMQHHTDCIEGRTDMLNDVTSIIHTPFVLVTNDDGVTVYQFTITIFYPAATELFDTSLVVYQIPGETTYIFDFQDN